MLSTTFLVPLLLTLFSPLALSAPPTAAAIVHGPVALADYDYPDLPIVRFSPPNATSATSDATRAIGVQCDTTRASPRLHEIDNVIRNLLNVRNSWCANTNAFGSRCSRVMHAGVHAAVSLCGGQFRIKCGDLAVVTRQIKNGCQWEMWAGGRFLWPTDFRAALHKN
ncbi:hypothetical protein EDC01DRAFT_785350 [Geopyxis carbonaria]|nr:hypothetical protein EDC01DRAFT_785350 [Geopyxis carbonaria]